jgi:hypothetical protein
MISLSGYRCIRNASVYAQPPPGRARQVILMERWYTPTLDEIFGRLHDTVATVNLERLSDKRYVASLVQKGECHSGEVLSLPPELLLDLKQRAPRAREYLASVMPMLSDDAKSAHHMFDCSVGRLPGNRIKDRDVDWYWQNFREFHGSSSLGLRFRLAFQLLDGALPPKEEFIDQVLEPPAEARSYSENEMRTLLQSLYAGLDSPERLLEVPDVSAERAHYLMHKTLESMRENIFFTSLFMEGVRAGRRGVGAEGSTATDDDDLMAVKPDETVN